MADQKLTQLTSINSVKPDDIIYNVHNPGGSPLSRKMNASGMWAGYNMINGKIVPSVTSNNLTLALKGLDGNDPSDTNPVSIFFPGASVWRVVTAALSVTINAGADGGSGTFNAGSTELKTQEIDYFAYAGFNATDGVVIAFGRIPFAKIYSDFNTTNSNEKHAAISTITHAAAGDEYTVLGRFAATNSGTASYNWSVPSFTPVNLIQYPIFETRELSYVPTITSQAGTLTTVSGQSGKYFLQYNKFFIFGSHIITTNGTGASWIIATIPFTATNYGHGIGYYSLAALNIRTNGATVMIMKYDGSYPGADGASHLYNCIARI